MKVEFQTRNGRVVYDGGGIDPDVATEVEYLSDVSVSLSRKDLIFDYATIYKLNNPNLRDGIDFRVNDTEYADFVAWVQDKDYEYSTESESMLAEFKEVAEEEEYFDAIEAEFKALESKIHSDKKNDLIKQSDEIKRLLENEIVTRYFIEKGPFKIVLSMMWKWLRL